jgi:2,3-bisphosphoglycerate-independent phosphoglycerate mutase
VRDLEARLAADGGGARIATVGGRYYAMDRDRRWERTERGWAAIVRGEGLQAASATAAIEAGYARGEDDEFLQPTVIRGVDGRVRDGDSFVTCNFRADRMRQLVHALSDGDDFAGFRWRSPSRPWWSPVWRNASPSSAGASTTSPRRRSTRM